MVHGGDAGRSRRRTLLAAALGAAVAAGGCRRAGAARPATQAGVRTVPVQLHVQAPASATVQGLVQGHLDVGWNARHRGVRLVYQPWGDMPAVVASLTAGAGPWIIAGCCYDFATAMPFLAPLDAELRRDNLSTGLWSAGQLETFRLASGLFAVPAYTAAQVYFYRQDILDRLGLSYPDPAWTYRDAESLWRRCAGGSGTARRYAATLSIDPGDIAEGYGYLHGFGGAFLDASRTRCLLGLPGSIRAGQWVFTQIWDRICTTGNIDGTGLNSGIASGSVVFSSGAGQAVLWAARNLGSGVKWDFIPFPRWPVRRAAGVNSDFYGLSNLAPDQALAWEIFRYVTLDPNWNDFVMRLTLQQPALVDQWDRWEAVVRAAAPVLRGKRLGYWREAAVRGEGYGVQFFKYQPLQAITLLDATWRRLWARQIGVQTAFVTIADQIDALQASASHGGPGPDGAQLVAAARLRLRRLRRMFAGGAGAAASG